MSDSRLDALAARRARRAAIRHHHPDTGGSEAALIAALAAAERAAPPMVFSTTRRSRLSKLSRRLRLTLRRGRLVIHDHEFIQNHEGTTS
ncbi:hypothetical protein AB0K11_00160 [Mycobacterium sp. NPDC050551]|uniref:hypothetical protein n=1 Tax=Mycobacterium sp. NPDC050551 TaxID=3155407 RepID=UPI003446CAB0